MKFRLVCYDTEDEIKYCADKRYEYLGNKEDIWQLWFMLTSQLNKFHVEIYSLDGLRQEPEKGINGLSDYNV